MEEHSKIETIPELKDQVKDVFVPVIYKESLIGRSFREKDNKFKQKTFKVIRRLRLLIDADTISNQIIRAEIENLSKATDRSIGQSQKVINVYLKFYCLLSNKPESINRELDCPLDRWSLKTLLPSNIHKTLEDIGLEEYQIYQNTAEKIFKIRLLADQGYNIQRLGPYVGVE